MHHHRHSRSVHLTSPGLTPLRSRCCQVVQVSDAQTTEQQVSTPAISWGSSMVQGPRPTMEDELRLDIDCKNGFTFAGEVGPLVLSQHTRRLPDR